MALRAAFAEMDITPSLPIGKTGWLMEIQADTILDPIFARAAVLEADGRRVAFVSLDILSIRWTQVCRIREIGERLGIPADNLLVAATHNHAGPATVSINNPREEEYCEWIVERVGEALQAAVEALTPARLAVQSCTEGRISFVRRYRMKDGSTRTHPPQASPDMRCAEGVIDPELGIVCVVDENQSVLGFLTNFTCHPTHHGGDTTISGGWPGQFAQSMKGAFGPDIINVFLNGAFGDVHHANPLDPGYVDDPARMGRLLTRDVEQVFPNLEYVQDVKLSTDAVTLRLPYREIEGEHGRAARFRQRFEGPRREGAYDRAIERLAAKQGERDYALAQVQCIRLGDHTAFVTIPAEYFVGHGLRIKIESPFANTYVVGAANGMVGYVPLASSFPGGGYETTLALWSKLAPPAGDMLAEAALTLLHKEPS